MEENRSEMIGEPEGGRGEKGKVLSINIQNTKFDAKYLDCSEVLHGVAGECYDCIFFPLNQRITLSLSLFSCTKPPRVQSWFGR